MKNEKLKIEGMSCGHCVMAVKKELLKLPVNIKDVSIGSAEVEYDETKTNREEIKNAITNAGYSVVNWSHAEFFSESLSKNQSLTYKYLDE